MKKSIGLLLFLFISCVSAQPNKNIDDLKNYLKSKKEFKVNPKVDCYSVDTCYIKLKDVNVKVIKAKTENEPKEIILNNNVYLINTLYNEKEELSIERLEFPDYENSLYYYIEDSLYIINTIPYCTGIACKYRYIQFFDLKNKVVYEKKIKWDK